MRRPRKSKFWCKKGTSGAEIAYHGQTLFWFTRQPRSVAAPFSFSPPILTMRLSRPLLFVGQFPTYSATSRNFSFVRSGVMYLAVKRTKSKRDPSTYLNRKESIFMDIAMKLQQILLHLYYTPGFSFRISSFKLFAILNFTAVFVARLLTIISYFNIESGTYVLR